MPTLNPTLKKIVIYGSATLLVVIAVSYIMKRRAMLSA